MKNKKFMLMFTASTIIFLQGCSVYEKDTQDYVLKDVQETASMTLGEAKYINLYNLKSPVSLTIKAPPDKKIYYKSNNTYGKERVIELNPRDKIALAFEVEDKDGKKESVDFRLNTYKVKSSIPENGISIREKSGKITYLAGYVLNYSLATQQNETQIDLDDFKYKKYVFNFSGNVSDLKIKILPPKDSFFIFHGGITKDTYDFNITSDMNNAMTLYIQYKGSQEVYAKQLYFNLNKLTNINKLKP